MFKKWTHAFPAVLALMAATAISPTSVAQAQWPTKPVTYVVPFAVAGNTETLARIIGQKL